MGGKTVISLSFLMGPKHAMYQKKVFFVNCTV